jgi:MFS family permease|tara:strand:+ start:141 stop:1472 length:1332 start_codon:yes stop_codon:yes gene_type:complete
MCSRRFAPLFLTQWGGAFNDNFFKSSLLIMFTYKNLELAQLSVNVVNNLVAATLILPFLVFAAFAAQFADKYEKSGLMRGLKLAELCIMVAAAAAFWLGNAWLMLLALFCMGVQSACFSPLKYAILPQHITEDKLVAANSLLHAGTSLAVFMGLIGGSIAAQMPAGTVAVAAVGVVIALLGYWSSRAIPAAEAASPELRLVFNPLRQYRRCFAHACENRMVFWSIIGISWYWFLGSVYLTQLPNLVRSVLGGAPPLVPLFLVFFLMGTCAGAALTSRLSRGRVEPGLVPLGGVLITLVGCDLYWAASSYQLVYPLLPNAELIDIQLLLTRFAGLRVLLDFTLLGAVGGLFIVPLTALLQTRTCAASRAQVIGANNFVNALFMIAAALISAVFLGLWDFSIAELFGVSALFNLLILASMLLAVAEYWQRLCVRFFRVRESFCER